MTITHRRILYSVFFLLFFLAAPVLLLATAGYRIDFPRRVLFKTSTIVLSLGTPPDRTLLDGKAIRSRGTTLRLNALTPGIHAIRLEKEGYHPWEKAVSVEAGEAVSLPDIHLIRRAEPRPIAHAVRSFAVSPDQRMLAIVQKKTDALILHNVTDGTDATVFATGMPTALKDAVWSPSGQQLLLRGDPDIWAVLSPFSQNPAAHALLLPRGTERVEWNPMKDGSVFALHDGELLQYEAAEDESVVLEQNVLDWQHHDGALLTLQQMSDGRTAVMNSAHAPEPLAILSRLLSPRFLPSPPRVLTILDAQQQTLTVLDVNDPARRFVLYQHVAFADWSDSGSDLLFGNAMELNTAHRPLEEATVQTITRGSSGLWSATWMQKTPYALANQGASMKIFETSFGNPHQSFTVFTAPQRQAAQIGDKAVLILDAKDDLFSLPVF